MNTNKDTDNRRRLLDMAKGGAYWIEILRHEDTGGICYQLHKPSDNDARGGWRSVPVMPTTWQGVQMLAEWHTETKGAADQLPKIDKGRTYRGQLQPEATIQAALKWCKK